MDAFNIDKSKFSIQKPSCLVISFKMQFFTNVLNKKIFSTKSVDCSCNISDSNNVCPTFFALNLTKTCNVADYIWTEHQYLPRPQNWFFSDWMSMTKFSIRQKTNTENLTIFCNTKQNRLCTKTTYIWDLLVNAVF